MGKPSYANVVLNSGNKENSGESSGCNIVANEDVIALKLVTDDDLGVINSNLHPLYLQNIDHLGLVLISKKLTGT